MNYQEIGILTVILLITMVEGTFLACGGFETIKEAMQVAGGAIWRMISWPWRRMKQKKESQKIFLEYTEKNKEKLIAEMMKTIPAIPADILTGWNDINDDVYKMLQGAGNRTEDIIAAIEGNHTMDPEMENIKGEEQWKQQIMRRFMRKM